MSPPPPVRSTSALLLSLLLLAQAGCGSSPPERAEEAAATPAEPADVPGGPSSADAGVVPEPEGAPAGPPEGPAGQGGVAAEEALARAAREDPAGAGGDAPAAVEDGSPPVEPAPELAGEAGQEPAPTEPPPPEDEPGLPLAAEEPGVGPATPGPAEPPARDPDLANWRALLERDRRVGFTARTEEFAAEALDLGLLSDEDRAAALYAIGAAGAVHERPRLEEAILIGSLPERRAAILGLGEAGSGVEQLLGAEVEDPEIGEAALFALLRTGRLSARRRAQEIAEGDGPLAAAVPELLRFLADREHSRPTPTTELMLELRWRGAKAYGLVDGEAWSTLLLARLLQDETFLDAVVLPGAAELSRAGVRDHLVGPLLEGLGGAPAVRAAVHALPEELEEMIRYELWRPGPEDWHSAVAQIEEDGAPETTVPLLERAREVPELRLRALALLARAGETDALAPLAQEWPYLSPDDQVIVAEAWGSSALEEARKWLDGREREASPRVRAAVLLARARLGVPGARDRVVEALGQPAAEEQREFAALCTELAWDRFVASLLGDALESLAPEQQVPAAAALCQEGRLDPLPIVLEALAGGLPEGEVGLEVLKALHERGTAEDRQLVARLFPFEKEGELPPEVNTLLLRLMLRDKNLRTLPVLRAALWRDPFDRSLLAGALIIEVGGGYALRQEILRRPTDRTERDYRRVGFALGEFRGVEGLRALAAHPRIHPGDPVLQGAFLGAMASRTH